MIFEADQWDHNPDIIPLGFYRMNDIPQDYYEVSSSHLHREDTRWILETVFTAKIDIWKVLGAIEFHPFIRNQTQFDAADSMENLILKVASIVLLRAFHYKKYFGINAKEKFITAFIADIRDLWAVTAGQMQTPDDQFITTWRAFYILNYSKALIDNQSKYLKDFSSDYTSFAQLNCSDFYKLDEVDYTQNPQKYIFSDPFIKKSYEEVLAVKKDFFKFMDSKKFERAVQFFCGIYGKWSNNLNAIIPKLKNVQFYFTICNIGVLGACGANQILISYDSLISELDPQLRRARLFFQFCHEIGHAEYVTSVAFSPGNQTIASSSCDRRIKL